MKDNDALNVGQTPTSHRRKVVFTAFTLLALLIISVLVYSSWYQQNLRTNQPANPVSFACRPSWNNQTFTIIMELNLIDGMDEAEAIRVAYEVYGREHIQPRPPVSMSSTAHMNEDGIWTVEFSIVYSSSFYCAPNHLFTRVTRDYFKVIIDPFVKTVVYART